ncbi:hypothetical protein NIES2100_16220 [Calothrix sp. NIES-2100]|uniref:hypothetical protein n=1 Tax=Calothrix sp. NIES-2100 TaxID=1954172 RepID=UPI000B5EE14C|nr:hypothetical protein NIES2100_16220 [Calothrix sp. NIES-2100]
MTQSNIQPQEYELYHTFVPYKTAKQGGTTTITLRSGKSLNINIPTNTSEGDELSFTRPSLEKKHNLFSKIREQINRQVLSQSSDYQKDIKIVLHTLFDKQKNIESILFNLIDKTDIKSDSKIRCKKVYEKIKDGIYLDDFAALGLLDFIVSSSQLDSLLRQQYNIASHNSRLRKLDKCIEDTLALSDLKENQQQLIKGTYQYIKAGDYNTNFSVIKQLDSIIDHSFLPEEIK